MPVRRPPQRCNRPRTRAPCRPPLARAHDAVQAVGRGHGTGAARRRRRRGRTPRRPQSALWNSTERKVGGNITTFQMQGHHSCLCGLPISISREPGSSGVQAIKQMQLHHLSHANLILTLLGLASHPRPGTQTHPYSSDGEAVDASMGVLFSRWRTSLIGI